jgi:hypothetical protein
MEESAAISDPPVVLQHPGDTCRARLSFMIVVKHEERSEPVRDRG